MQHPLRALPTAPPPRSPGGCLGSQGGQPRQCLALLLGHLSMPGYPDPGGEPHKPQSSSLWTHGGTIWASFQKEHRVT